ncbi:MAG: twin-arginine translocation signal domain-containing protein [Verrucomicrobiota bacterium]|jgi:hypothetical protein
MNKPENKNEFNRRDFLKGSSAVTLMTMLGAVPLAAQPATSSTASMPGGKEAPKDSDRGADFPRVWLSSPKGALPAAKFEDLVSHGVQVIETTDIAGARQHGLQVMLASDVDGMFMGEIIGPEEVMRMGLTPEYAVAIAGTYQDLGIDSHTFPFAKGKHTIEIGLPWHFAPYDWTTRKYFTNNQTFGGYFDKGIFSTDRAFKAEVVVKQQDYDGRQHLAIMPAVISDRGSSSLRLTFDLTNVEGDLDHTMLAVYWRTNQLSPAAASTREAAARSIRATLDRFTRENGGVFPDDVIRAIRFGDECFLRTGFVNSPKCAIPLYDYSDSGIAGYRKLNGNDEHPRAWGFPEVFGANAYRDWLYAYHTAAAELVKAVVTEAHKIAPRLLVFRNTTRFNPTPVATLANDHDGCSAQLLAQQFDMINPDPYPVSRTGDSQCTNPDRDPRPGYIESMIPLENAYWGGLVRRFGKKLVPWMQAHTFAHDLQHPMPSDVHHMYEQVAPYNPDGIMWLGYQPGDTAESPWFGMTLPDTRPETWKALRCINYRAQRDLGRPKKVPPVAVLRFYAERSLVDLERRNLHDRFLTEQILTGLTMDLAIPYDIFEYYRREDLDCQEMRTYRRVIMCVTDLEGLPLDELRRQRIPLAVVCWNASSLTAHSEFTGITELRQLPGEAIGITKPMFAGVTVSDCYSGMTEWKSNLGVTGSTGATIPVGLAWGATLRPGTTSIAKAGDQCCVWQYQNAIFSSFLPKDPFDDGEYVRWLLNGDIATHANL